MSDKEPKVVHPTLEELLPTEEARARFKEKMAEQDKQADEDNAEHQ